MGGGNGQKSFRAKQDAMRKAVATRSPEERAEAAAKAKRDREAILCQICRQGFPASVRCFAMKQHKDSKHPKVSIENCFAQYSEMEQAEAAAESGEGGEAEADEPKKRNNGKSVLASEEEEAAGLKTEWITRAADDGGNDASGGGSASVGEAAEVSSNPAELASSYKVENATALQSRFTEAVALIEDVEADEDLLTYVGEVASGLLEEHACDGPALREAFGDMVAPYLTSFMTEEQASDTLARVLQGLAIVPAGAATGAAAGPQTSADAPPLPAASGGSAAAAPTASVQQEAPTSAAADKEAAPAAAAPYVPRWAAAMAAPLPEDPAAAQEAKLRHAQLESQQAQAREVAQRQQQQRSGVDEHGAPLEGGANPDGSSLVRPLCDTVFSMAFGGRTLLARTRLHLERGRRYGLVGANGAGKSTLLRNLAARRIEGLPQSLRVALVQHAADSSVPAGSASAAGAASHAGGSGHGTQHGSKSDETVIQHLLASSGDDGSSTVDSSAAEAFAHKVGFLSPHDTKVATLSGGWHMRLSLARAMMSKAELLLLDEPTNHLDVEGVAWLTAYLQGKDDVTVVVVSHDAAFLDAVATDVLLLAHGPRQLEAFRGRYSAFKAQRPEIHAYLTRRTDLRGNNTLAGGDKFSLTFPRPDRLDGVGSDTKSVLRLSAVTFAYPDGSVDPDAIKKADEGDDDGGVPLDGQLKVVLRSVDCKLAMRSKVAVLGGNGAGKSTLVRLLVGDLMPLTGDVWRHSSLRIAYVAQHSLGHVEQHLTKTPVEYLQWRFAGAVDREALALTALQVDGSEDNHNPQGGAQLDKIVARRTRHGQLEYECSLKGRGPDENEWRSLRRLVAEGHQVECLRYDQVVAGVAAGLDLRPLTVTETQNHLTDFGLDPFVAGQTKIGGLSGGQKAKLVFAAALWTKPHVLVLDEPTNYLDKETLDALKSALRRFKGAFVVVSHNRDFVTGLCSEEWRVSNGRCQVVQVNNDEDDEDSSSGKAAVLTPEEEAAAEREAELAEAGAALLAAKGGGGVGGGGGSSGASWAAGTVTTANMYGSGEIKAMKDAKGRLLSKKELRALEKKNKDALKKKASSGDNNDNDDDDDDNGGDRKETAAEKKARRLAKKIAKEVSSTGSAVTGSSSGGGKQTLVEAGRRAGLAATNAELNQELERAHEVAVRQRVSMGTHRGAVETEAFTLPNPGGGADLLEESSFVLVPGRRYGLIGRNGTGKSTMLKALAARRVVAFPENMAVYYVHQDVQLSPEALRQTAAEVVVAADAERRLLLQDQKDLELVLADKNADPDAASQATQSLATVTERLDAIGADSAATRATGLLTHLGFTPELLARPMEALSGGWRVRVALAAALFARPDVLLLDEPTNHLSIQAVLWLARELCGGGASSEAVGGGGDSSSGSGGAALSSSWENRIVIVVSHDRHFLDEVCTDTLHLSGRAKRLTPSRGNYTLWAGRRKQLQDEFARRTALRAQEREKLDGFKTMGSGALADIKKMKNKQIEKLDQEALEDAEEGAALQEDLELPLKLLSGWDPKDPGAPSNDDDEVLTSNIVELRNVGFNYQGDRAAPMLFQGAEFNVDAKSRLVLLGENGNGKTTLVKLLVGDLKPTIGEAKITPGCRVAVVNQHHADQIDLDLTPLAFMKRQFPGDGSYNQDQKLRSHLASCGVGSDKMLVPARALSGGQRSRVALAATSFARPHLLILDEPTNNLDLEAVAALADAVEAFRGGVVLVSHDQYFVARVAKQVKVVGEGKVTPVESFEAYRAQQLKKMDL